MDKNQTFQDLIHLAMQQTMFAVTITTFNILGIIFNGAVFTIILWKKNQRRPLDQLIANLSIADFLYCTADIAYYGYRITSLSSAFSSNRLPVTIRNYVCKLFVFFVSATIGSSWITLAIISYERLQAIRNPFGKQLKIKRTNILILIMWIIVIILSFLVMNTYTANDFVPYYCSMNDDILYNAIVNITFILITAIIPYLVIITCYSKMFYALKCSTVTVDAVHQQPFACKANKKRIRKICVLIVITALPLFLTLPFLVILIYTSTSDILHWNPKSRHSFYFYKYVSFSWLLSVIPAVINPILYNFCSENFRFSVRILIRKCIAFPKCFS